MTIAVSTQNLSNNCVYCKDFQQTTLRVENNFFWITSASATAMLLNVRFTVSSQADALAFLL